MIRRAIQFLTSGVPVSLRRGVPSVVVLAAARSDYYGPLFTRKTLTRLGAVISLAILCTAAYAESASAETRSGFRPISACGLIYCPVNSVPRARNAIANFERNAETPVTIHDCRRDRRLVVCFLSRPYPPDPDSAIVAVEWWDCAGPSGKVTSSFTSERCQWAAYRAFPELRI